MPMMLMTRSELASTCSAISEATRGSVFIRKWVVPPGLDGAEGMFDRLAALAHLLRMLVEPALNGFENVLMFPIG